MTRREQAVELIDNQVKTTYTQYYPVHCLVEQTQALRFTLLITTGTIIYESRDETHFIMPTTTICDLLRPMQYKYCVCRYNKDQVALLKDYYATELECRLWVTRWQAQHYKFDLTKYNTLKGLLVQHQQQLGELYKDAQDDDLEKIEMMNYLQLVLRTVRVNLGLPEDQDLPDVSIEEASLTSEGTRG